MTLARVNVLMMDSHESILLYECGYGMLGMISVSIKLEIADWHESDNNHIYIEDRYGAKETVV